MTSNYEPIAVLITDVDPEKISLSMPKKGAGSSKPESYVSYMGRPLAIQFGTATDPISCPYGLERWVQSKPDRIKSSDPTWAVSDNSMFNKLRTAKLSGNLRLTKYNEEGSFEQKVVAKLEAIIERIVNLFVNGVKDDNGNTVKLWDANLPAEVVRRMITTPLREATEDYPPSIKFKARFRVVNEHNKTLSVSDPADQAKRLALDCEIFDGAQEATKTAIDDPLDSMFSGSTTGIWMFKVNPVLIGKSSANLTFELTRAKIVRRAGFFSGAADFQSDGVINTTTSAVGGFGTGCAVEVEEPLAKRAKVDGSASPGATFVN